MLDAAAEEFARSGIAGARVERIVQAARTNKAQLYGYFGSKDGLFDAVVLDAADRITTAVPLRDGDLADWAVRLYDETLARPEMLRLTTWLRLERRPAGHLFNVAAHSPKLEEIAKAQAAGRIRPGDPFELMAMVIAMACTWSPVSGVYAATPDEPDTAHERRRTLLRESVQRAVAPLA